MKITFTCEHRLPPSRRHPDGLPRCQRVIRREGTPPRQCERGARLGFPVCGMHGAGFAAREQRGERESVVSNFVDGQRAKPATIQSLLKSDTALGELFEDNMINPRLTDMRPIIAMQRALVDWWMNRADLNDPKVALRGIAMLGRLCRSLEIWTNRERPGFVPLSQVDDLLKAFAAAMAQHLPPDKVWDARTFVRLSLIKLGPFDRELEKLKSFKWF